MHVFFGQPDFVSTVLGDLFRFLDSPLLEFLIYTSMSKTVVLSVIGEPAASTKPLSSHLEIYELHPKNFPTKSDPKKNASSSEKCNLYFKEVFSKRLCSGLG